MIELNRLISCCDDVIKFITENGCCDYDCRHKYFYRDTFDYEREDLVDCEVINELISYFDKKGKHVLIRPFMHMPELKFRCAVMEKIDGKIVTKFLSTETTRRQAVINGLIILMREEV